MMRVCLLVEYDGSAYHGWQRQSHCRSVQETLERAVAVVANEPITIFCAGRTDTGVHACGQVVHFDTTANRTERSWMLGTNSQLPADISVRRARLVADDFHARYDASERHYRYLILNSASRSALHAQRAWVVHEPLEVERMQQAASQLLGEHDFSAFRAAGCQARHPNRFVRALSVRRCDDWLIVDIAANAFLHHMVRNIVGALVHIGNGSADPARIRYWLEQRDRALAPAMAPAGGLFLSRVCYSAESHGEFPPCLPLLPDASRNIDALR